MSDSVLHRMLDESARRRPGHPAVEEISGSVISYAEFAALSDRLRDRLVHLGVVPGDRVGVCVRKSIDAVVTIFGILKAGAAYVPVDVSAPVSRTAYIFDNCKITALVVEEQYAPPLEQALAELDCKPAQLVIGTSDDGNSLGKTLESAQAANPAAEVDTCYPEFDDLAYILYTSGSTGKPKGVKISHRAARFFVDWCSETFEPRDEDRFSSHAPFHFDLSIHDIYVPIKHGASLVLIDPALGGDPARLAPVIAEKRISIWYSAPSILSLLTQYGNLERFDYSALRTVLFAGEVFPVRRLHELMKLLPHPRYYNLYGPTETNVCTYYEIPADISENRTEPYPIGSVCSSYRGRVVDELGKDVTTGEMGELCISGDGVMLGYWDLDRQTADAFLDDDSGSRWYRTGDIVVDDGSGIYIYRGRRDRMVKRRGYRVELGEIEACLYQDPALRQVAVIADQSEDGVTITAFLSTVDGSRPSTLKLKKFCSERLPLYMIPDRFAVFDSLPTTSTDKIDYQSLRGLL